MIASRWIGPLCAAVLLAGVILAAWPLVTVWHGEAATASQPGGQVYVHYHLLHAARTTVWKYGQFPFRSPWHGGYPTIGFPKDSSLTPRLVLALIFGEVPALKVDFVLAYVVAALGMYLMCRRVVGFGRWGAMGAALALAFSGFLPSLMMTGVPSRMRWCLAPLLIALVADRRRPRASLMAAAIILAVVVLDGGLAIYSVAVLLGLVWLLQLHRRPTDVMAVDGRYAGRLLGVFAWGAIIAAPKLIMVQFAVGPYREREPVPWSWPTLAYWVAAIGLLWAIGAGAWLRRRRLGVAWWPMVAAAAIALLVAAAYLSPTSGGTDPPRRIATQWAMMTRFRTLGDFDPGRGAWRTQVWFNIAVGYGWLALAVLGAVVRWRSLGRWSVLLVIAVLFQLGNDLPFDLAILAHPLPLLREWDANISQEILQPAVLLAVAVLAGGLVDWIAVRLKGPWGPAVGAALIVVNTAWLIPQHWRGIRDAYRYRTPEGAPADRFYTIHIAKRVRAGNRVIVEYPPADRPWPYYWAKRNVAALPWDMRLKDPYWRRLVPRFFTANGDPGPARRDLNSRYPGAEVWLARGVAGTARFAKDGFTPNRLRIEADIGSESGTVVINQRYDPLWTSSAGEVLPLDGLLAIRLDGARAYTGDDALVLRYRPRRFYLGAAASLASLIIVPVFFALRKRPESARKARTRRGRCGPSE